MCDYQIVLISMSVCLCERTAYRRWEQMSFQFLVIFGMRRMTVMQNLMRIRWHRWNKSAGHIHFRRVTSFLLLVFFCPFRSWRRQVILFYTTTHLTTQGLHLLLKYMQLLSNGDRISGNVRLLGAVLYIEVHRTKKPRNSVQMFLIMKWLMNIKQQPA